MGRPLIAIGVPFRRGGFTQITNDYITRVYAEGGTLTDTEKSAINELTLNPDIGEFDRLWVHGLQNEIAARTSVVNALTADLITNVNSTTFTAGQGFQGNGTTMYLDTNYNPSVDGVKYTLNSASGYAYSLNSAVDLGASLGAYSPPNCSAFLRIRGDGNVFNSWCNTNGDTVNLTSSNTDGTGFYSTIRTGASLDAQYKNGVLQNSGVNPSVPIPNLNIYLLCGNYSGVSSSFSNGKIAFSGFGSGAIDQSQFYTATQTLGTTLGWAV